MNSVKLIHITPEAEKVIVYCARVSSKKQDTENHEKLLKYCIKYKHWSIFQMSSMCIEIKTSRAIAQQILRHRSFNFQEFSQRYQETTSFCTYDARRQDDTNRQNSIDDMSEEDKHWFEEAQTKVQNMATSLYKEAIHRKVAKEQARFLLPLSTETKLYMHGTIRDFIHYCNVRTDVSTQKEHRDIAEQIKEIMKQELPEITKALDW